ncbi:5-formyltetrahydrofolate cyclo-ligase [Shewanella algae]|uniref:5-formyltetrahydrofolate cyclo-ligase n=1 Tax=Shewanella algae TaxID=38313 RepID=UPI0005ECA4F2|nr:5-formyltetrahydrofolate cyclo-ligase [Shewanella algae]MBO2579308.1 5-formyltetrahydrofolate cyclo-ligase [Shewanella algae]MBO2684761.1 5-formyltetrahydrofolate cyclo-ligase [Shewanella algae]MBO2701957.1 5-formyltetrahydrofolate cyclo-ligase [Shewanella algae]PBQ29614.1 hypothetical protein AYI97_01875 [Shewanella algae]BCV27014.1 5-formyltetrahydrofolate cyclo-ligase [Shewanella algae]
MTHTDSSSQTRDARCKTLRQAIRHARRAIPEAEQHVAALKGCEQFLTLLDELSAQGREIKTVALYFSCDGELDTAPLIEALWQRGVTTCLPIIHPFAPGRLLFLRYQLSSQLHANRFGIPEPRLDIRSLVPLAELDLILTPLVAFDAQGNRMGMGGGFYDRTLAAAQQIARTVPLLAVGFAHTLQLVDSLPLAPWDIPLPFIVTPGKLHSFNTLTAESCPEKVV